MKGKEKAGNRWTMSKKKKKPAIEMGRSPEAQEEKSGGGGGGGTVVWTALHDFLLEEILRRLSLRDFLRSGAVFRSWLEVRKHSPNDSELPWLLCRSDLHPDVFFSPWDEKRHRLRLWSASETYLSASHSWHLMCQTPESPLLGDRAESSYLFMNPITRARVNFVDNSCWIHEVMFSLGVALSAPPSDPDCSVVASFPMSQYFISFLLCDVAATEGFTAHQLPDIADGLEFHSLIFCRGRVYALCCGCCLVVIDLATQDASFIKMDLSDWPSVPSRDSYSVLVESVGEILMVGVLNCTDDYGQDEPPIVKIELFREDLAARAWTRLESLGGRALFISRIGSSVSVPTGGEESNICGDCIYVANCDKWLDEAMFRVPKHQWLWMVYNLRNGRKSFHENPIVEDGSKKRHLVWITPSLH